MASPLCLFLESSSFPGRRDLQRTASIVSDNARSHAPKARASTGRRRKGCQVSKELLGLFHCMPSLTANRSPLPSRKKPSPTSSRQKKLGSPPQSRKISRWGESRADDTGAKSQLSPRQPRRSEAAQSPRQPRRSSPNPAKPDSPSTYAQDVSDQRFQQTMKKQGRIILSSSSCEPKSLKSLISSSGGLSTLKPPIWGKTSGKDTAEIIGEALDHCAHLDHEIGAPPPPPPVSS